MGMMSKKAKKDGTYDKYPSFNYFEVLDVVRLVKNGKIPDGNYGDNECNLWSAISSIMEYGEDSMYIDRECKEMK